MPRCNGPKKKLARKGGWPAKSGRVAESFLMPALFTRMLRAHSHLSISFHSVLPSPVLSCAAPSRPVPSCSVLFVSISLRFHFASPHSLPFAFDATNNFNWFSFSGDFVPDGNDFISIYFIFRGLQNHKTITSNR